ncbi:MAG: amino acid racemase [Eubacteriales bacterium]|jgi:aspartate racemase|nr:amino acid racemase [Eubacteriales bacterium]
MKKDKYFGVIGGMGSKATSVFFERLIGSSKAEKDQDHMNVMILNHATLPDRTEVIIENKENDFLNCIKKDFEIMEFAGVTDVAIPCNSAHFFYEDMKKMTNINIINMIEETVKVIHKTHGEGTKVGLLATDGTVRSALYNKYCEQYNLDMVVPDLKVQQDIMKVIYGNIKGHMNLDSSLLEELIEFFVYEEKCKTIIIGCTELSCIPVREELKRYTLDAMNVLVEKSIEIYDKY